MGADMTTARGRDLITAFELVHEAAMEGRLIAESDEMLDQEAAQLEAVSQAHDFLTNHHEEIEDRFGRDPELVGAEAPGELDLTALREAAVDHPLNEAMLTTIELAAQQCTDDDLTGRLSDALDLVGAFWARRGAEICSETRSVSIPDGPE